MATLDTETLAVSTRSESGSRAMRRLRRSGRVPGVIYGGDAEPLAFEADARLMRNVFSHAGALLQISLDGRAAEPVLIKSVQHHPVRGDIVHADLVRVDMNVSIQAQIPVELLGADHAPGVVEGGVLSQETRELTVEALPADMPEVVQFDVSGLQINETATLASLSTAGGNFQILDDPEATVIATITPPTQEPTEEEIETETAVVGERGEVEASKAAGDTGDEAEAAAQGEGNAAESA